MGAKPLKAVLEQIVPSYITPIKIGIRHFRVAFPHILYAYHRETYRTGIKQSHNFGLNVYARGFAYTVATLSKDQCHPPCEILFYKLEVF